MFVVNFKKRGTKQYKWPPDVKDEAEIVGSKEIIHKNREMIVSFQC